MKIVNVASIQLSDTDIDDLMLQLAKLRKNEGTKILSTSKYKTIIGTEYPEVIIGGKGIKIVFRHE